MPCYICLGSSLAAAQISQQRGKDPMLWQSIQEERNLRKSCAHPQAPPKISSPYAPAPLSSHQPSLPSPALPHPPQKSIGEKCDFT